MTAKRLLKMLGNASLAKLMEAEWQKDLVKNEMARRAKRRAKKAVLRKMAA